MVVTDEGETDRERVVYEREDSWAATTNEELNLVRHVKSLLEVHWHAQADVLRRAPERSPTRSRWRLPRDLRSAVAQIEEILGELQASPQ